MDFPPEERDNIIEGLWNKTIGLLNLGKSEAMLSLYNKTVAFFHKAVDVGYKVNIEKLAEFDVPDKLMIKALKNNCYIFSGAKTFHFAYSTKNLMVDANDNLIPKNEFLKLAKANFDIYNKNWAETEYDTVLSRAQGSRAEVELQRNKSILPYATWVTSHLETVCPICAPMNGISLPVDHPFWSDHPIPAHYKCHCLKQATEHPGYEMMPKDLSLLPVFPEGFRDSNMDGKLFDKTQPYYQIPKADKNRPAEVNLRKQFIKLAKRNYSFPLPTK